MGEPCDWPTINRRRGVLINLKARGVITDEESAELDRLQELADQHIARVAPRPTGVLERLERSVKGTVDG